MNTTEKDYPKKKKHMQINFSCFKGKYWINAVFVMVIMIVFI